MQAPDNVKLSKEQSSAPFIVFEKEASGDVY
jgi:hypothetical protein